MDSDGNPLAGFVLFFILILLDGGLFGFGSALRAVNESEIEKEKEQGNKKAEILSAFKVDPEHMIHTIQFGATLLSLSAGGLVLSETVKLMASLLGRMPAAGFISQEVFHGISVGLSAFCLLFFLCTFGILLPKRLGMYHCRAWAFGLVPYVCLAEKICRPLTYLISGVTNLMLKLFGINPDELQEDVTEEEILFMVNEGHEQGVLEASEAEMINNIFNLGDKEAQDIMTHRKNIVALNGERSLKENLDFMLNCVNSRFPVYEDQIDNITGIVHLKDAMKIHTENDYDNWLVKDIPGLVRPAVFIPETRNISSLFQSMRQRKLQMVMVADEYGQTAGLIAMEDILEEIVGNILDEYDEDENLIEELPDGSFLMDGMAPLDEVSEVLGEALVQEDFETLNGYLVYRLGRIPDEDESSEIREEHCAFRILSVENKTIKKVKVTRFVKELSEEKTNKDKKE